MKKRLFILIGIVAAFVLLYLLICYIGFVQKNIALSNKEKTPQEVTEMLKTSTKTTFSKLALQGKFENFTNIQLNDEQDENNMYYFQDTQQVEGILNILGKYQYYGIFELETLNDYKKENVFEIKLFEGENDNHLAIYVSNTVDEEICHVRFVLENNVNSVIESEYDSQFTNGLLVSSKIVDEMVSFFQKNIEDGNLEIIRRIISENSGELSVYALMDYRHTYVRTVNDYSTGDFYLEYKMDLDDDKGYLIIDTLELGRVGEDIQIQYMYIFNVDLYNENGELAENLYSDIDRYKQDLEIK
ncbi:MAG: hypothetical protein SPF70_04020 [Lachnospiraceae bacterium]|nr:hypothetical protein [Lachnospiraceae bacterium]